MKKFTIGIPFLSFRMAYKPGIISPVGYKYLKYAKAAVDINTNINAKMVNSILFNIFLNSIFLNNKKTSQV